jgi:hypothetical protein
VLLVKAGSSLWIDEDSFSSSKFEGAQYVEEDGVWFKLIDKEFKKEGKFSYSSPYFIV